MSSHTGREEREKEKPLCGVSFKMYLPPKAPHSFFRGDIMHLNFILFFYYCGTGWRYIVAFTKVLTMYEIYHT
jgi:hypothetical protein